MLQSIVICGTVAQEHSELARVGSAGVKGSNGDIVCSLLYSLKCTDYCSHYPLVYGREDYPYRLILCF